MDNHLQQLKLLISSDPESVAKYLNALVRAGKIKRKPGREEDSSCPNCKAYITIEDLKPEPVQEPTPYIGSLGAYSDADSIAIGMGAYAAGPYSIAIGANTVANPGETVIGDTRIQTCAFCGTIYNAKAWKTVRDLLNDIC